MHSTCIIVAILCSTTVAVVRELETFYNYFSYQKLIPDSTIIYAEHTIMGFSTIFCRFYLVFLTLIKLRNQQSFDVESIIAK